MAPSTRPSRYERGEPGVAGIGRVAAPAARTALLGLAVALAAPACSGPESGDTMATGTLEYVQVDIAALVPARVVRIVPREGDSVAAGDTLVVMTQSALHSDVDARRARLAAAQAQLRDVLAGARPTEIARAEAEVRGASADADRAQREVERVRTLVERGDVSRQQLDALESAAGVAAARRDAAREALRLIGEGARPQQVEAARAEVAGAQAALDAATHAVSDLVLTAPTSGVVISRHGEVGEVLPAGVSTMTIGDVAHPYVRVFVGPEILPLIRVGDTVAGTLDAFPERTFSGRIASVSTRAEFTPRVALTKEERSDLMYAVRLEFDDSSGLLKAGLPITVRFPRPVTR